MKKNLILLLLGIFLAGCSTYKFSRGQQKPYDQGYVVFRDGYMIPEYSLGENNSVPDDLELAKERFRRRRKTVEYYYRKLGDIQNGLERYFWNPCGMLIKAVFGQLQLPFVAMANHKYNRNPEYRKKIDKIEEERESRERARLEKIKDQLNTYVQKDLASERYAQTDSETATLSTTNAPVTQQTVQEKPTTQAIAAQEKVSPKIQPSVQASPVTKVAFTPKQTNEPKVKIKEKTGSKETKTAVTPGQVTARIIAKPVKGFSPLSVHFFGSKSSSSQGKIVSYLWDFGDGDTSTKHDPVNTYYSGSFEPREFTATLTAQDEKGNTAQTSITIQVLNK